MLAGIYSAASALKTAELTQDVIATNLAHMNVPGFRKSLLAVSTTNEGMPDQSELSPGASNTAEKLTVDFSAGPLVNSGRTLDVAINGDGFLAVQGENEVLYTRNGSLHTNAQGLLINIDGMPVLGTSGTITIPDDQGLDSLVISTDGTLTMGDQQLGQIRITSFEDNDKLNQVGTTLFSAAEASAQTDTEATLTQGVREQSNVQPMDELVSMIVALRYHEAAQRTLKSIDDSIHQNTSPQG